VPTGLLRTAELGPIVQTVHLVRLDVTLYPEVLSTNGARSRAVGDSLAALYMREDLVNCFPFPVANDEAFLNGATLMVEGRRVR